MLIFTIEQIFFFFFLRNIPTFARALLRISIPEEQEMLRNDHIDTREMCCVTAAASKSSGMGVCVCLRKV